MKDWKNYFRERAKQYGADCKACATYDSFFKLRCKAIRKFYSGMKGMRILDCGSGNGISTAFMTEENLVVGIDNIFEMLPSARENGLKPVAGDLDLCLPFKSSTFDSVVVVWVIQYLADTAKLLNEISRVLKPGGTLLLYSQNKDSWLRAMFSFLNDPGSGEFRRDSRLIMELMEHTGIQYVKTHLIRYPLPGVKEAVQPGFLKLGLSTSLLFEGKKSTG